MLLEELSLNSVVHYFYITMIYLNYMFKIASIIQSHGCETRKFNVNCAVTSSIHCAASVMISCCYWNANTYYPELIIQYGKRLYENKSSLN